MSHLYKWIYLFLHLNSSFIATNIGCKSVVSKIPAIWFNLRNSVIQSEKIMSVITQLTARSLSRNNDLLC